MTQEDIIRMAREAGLRSAVMLAHFKNWDALCDDEQDELDRLVSFAALVAAAENEACAKLCDEARAARLAEVIRARGQA
jgi:hypothetical protein